MEALYTFPVPKGASISNFSMWINGTEMVGEVIEKKRAREIYESYKQTRQDPGLLEQVDYKTFEMRIFPIAARAAQKVQLTYYQELEIDHDWTSYVYPLATTAQRNTDSRTGAFSFDLQMKSAIPITSARSTSHADQFAVSRHSEHYFQLSLEEEGVDLDRDIVVSAQLKRPVSGADLVVSKDGREDGYFCLTITASDDLAPHDAGADYVFILDISGSMGSEGKLSLSTDAIAAFVETLGPDDRFEVMTFNTSANRLFSQLQAPSPDTLRATKDFLLDAKARGGTALKPALTTAYRYARADHPLNVVILSDGMTEQRERNQLVHLIRQRPGGSRVFCVGVGNEVNRPLLEQLADDSGGLASFISRGDDFQRQASAFRRKLTRPAIESPQLSIDGVDIYDLEPAVLPNIYHGSPQRVYGRYRGSGLGQVAITGSIRGRLVTTTSELAFPARAMDNPELPRMWAWQRVDRLLKEADGDGSRQPVIDEIVRLGEGYGIATEYTSFLVLENNAEYQRWKIARHNVLRVERDRDARFQLQVQLDKMRQDASELFTPANQAAEDDDDQPFFASTQSTPPSQPGRPAAAPSQPRNNNRSIDFGGGGGTGPVGPLFLLLVGWLTARQRRPQNQDVTEDTSRD